MSIMLGNQTPKQIANRLKIVLSEEHEKELLNSWQQEVNHKDIADGKWHCFDIPFMLVCGDKETATYWRDVFMSYDLSNAELFQISWER